MNKLSSRAAGTLAALQTLGLLALFYHGAYPLASLRVLGAVLLVSVWIAASQFGAAGCASGWMVVAPGCDVAVRIGRRNDENRVVSAQTLNLSQERVLGAVRKYAGLPLTVSEIAAELGFSPDHCSRVAKELTEAGALERTGTGRAGDPYQYVAQPLFDEDACRVCGCTDDNACYDPTTPNGGCYWVEPDLCSACAYGIGGGA